MSQDLESRIVDTSTNVLEIEKRDPQIYLNRISQVLFYMGAKQRARVNALIIYRLYLEEKVTDPKDAIKTIAKIGGVDAGQLKYGNSKRHLASLRRIAYFAVRNLGCSFPETGRYFGGKDHSTIIIGCNEMCFDIIKYKDIVDAAFFDRPLTNDDVKALIMKYKNVDVNINLDLSKTIDLEALLVKLDNSLHGFDYRTASLIRSLVLYRIILEEGELRSNDILPRVTALAKNIFSSDISGADLLSRKRHVPISHLRAIACYLYRNSGLGFLEIGEQMEVDHSSVIYACDKVDNALKRYSGILNRIFDEKAVDVKPKPADLSSLVEDDVRHLSFTGRAMDLFPIFDKINRILAGMYVTDREFVKALIIYKVLLDEGGVVSSSVLTRIIEKVPTLSVSLLMSGKKNPSLSSLRAVASHIYRKFGLSYQEIATKFIGDHSSIVTAVRKVELGLAKYKPLIDAAFSDTELDSEESSRLIDMYIPKRPEDSCRERALQLCLKLRNETNLDNRGLVSRIAAESGIRLDQLRSTENDFRFAYARMAASYLLIERKVDPEITAGLVGYRRKNSVSAAHFRISYLLSKLSD